MDFRTRGIKLSKSIILIIYCVAVFFVAMIIISGFMNGGNTDMTMEMSEASLPVMSFRYGGYEYNRLYGYTSDMDVALMRDCITPLAEGRKLAFKIETYGNNVSKISYQLRTTDGKRLIEDTEVFNYVTGADNITGEIVLKDLIYKDTEYELCFILDTDNKSGIIYYTKIIDSDNLAVDDKLRFAYEFQQNSLDKLVAQSVLPTYIESNSKGDNSSFAYVDIHSSLNQITWGALNPEIVLEPKATIKAIDKETAVVELDYFLRFLENGTWKNLRVNEYFRMKMGSERMFLLDYKRTANESFSMDTSVLANNKIVLGIENENVSMEESPDGNKIAFVNDGRLYTYNTTDNKLAYVYGYYDGDVTDERNINNQHQIKIFNIDETGNVYFLVYGYMNRGIHEGEMGSAVYYYDSVLNTVEEKIYIKTNQSFDMLNSSMESISYVNRYNVFYHVSNGTLYKTNLENNNETVVVERLNNNNSVINVDKSAIAWVEDVNEKYGSRIVLYDLEKSKQVYIEAEDGMILKPIGFLGTDIIYGVINKSDISKNILGRELLPMRKVVISNGNKVVKEYEEPGQYIVNYQVDDKIIHLERATSVHDDGTYSDVTYDQILNNASEVSKKNSIETAVTERYETIVQIALKKDIESKSLQVLTPKQVILEKNNNAKSDINEDYDDSYYIYNLGKFCGKSTYLSDAVIEAYNNLGIVVKSDGRVLYRKKSRTAKNQIMAIDGTSLDENGTDNTIAVCLNTMLEYEGISIDTSRNIRDGEEPFSILERNLQDADILDLSGAPLDAVLNYVEADYPVLAYVGKEDAVLIIGYNEFNTVLLNPKTGTIYKYGINDSTELFENNGNRFITYIKYKD